MSNALLNSIVSEQNAILSYIADMERNEDDNGFAVDINVDKPLAFNNKVQVINDRVFHEVLDFQNTIFLVCLFDDGSVYIALDEDEAFGV